MMNKKIYFKPITNKLVLGDLFLLIPAGIYWISVLMYNTIGNDYLYETTIQQMGETKMGNALLIFLVVMCPIIVLVTNGVYYFKTKKKAEKLILIGAAILMVMGIYAMIQKV